MSQPLNEHTRVAIVGAGPAGLLLSHLLAEAGIESIVFDSRTRAEIEQTVRAGILEHETAQLLSTVGTSSRVFTTGQKHEGIEIQLPALAERIDLTGLTGRSVWLYPQHEVLKDLLAARLAAGQDIRFSTTIADLSDTDSTSPKVHGTTAEGQACTVSADFVVGTDGSRSIVRGHVAGARSEGFVQEYPFAWFGILCTAPPSSPELIYSRSDNGFALISQRNETVQRMYFQCDPSDDPAALSDQQIWDTLQARVPHTELIEGEIFQRDVLKFRSYVAAKLQLGRVALAGDAAHTVPPTGAKGMNLAIADVLLLNQALQALLLQGDEAPLARYEEVALDRIWKAQHFSWWMTRMLHTAADATPFEVKRQNSELQSVLQSEAGQTFLAEGYTGWPLRTSL